MGTWGHNNLDGDGPQDIISRICDDYFTRIIAALKSPYGHDPMEYDHDELFALCEMLFAMADRGMVNSSPDPAVLRPLFAPFLDRWEAEVREGGFEPEEERRAVMEETFRRLLVIAEGSRRGSFEHRIDLITDKMSAPKKPAKSKQPKKK